MSTIQKRNLSVAARLRASSTVIEGPLRVSTIKPGWIPVDVGRWARTSGRFAGFASDSFPFVWAVMSPAPLHRVIAGGTAADFEQARERVEEVLNTLRRDKT